MRRADAKPDTFNPNAPYVELDGGLGFVQNEIMFGPDQNPAMSTTICSNRNDSVYYLVGEKAFSRGGKLLGKVDKNNGNALIPLVIEEKPKAKPKPKAKAKAKPKAEVKAEAETKDKPSGEEKEKSSESKFKLADAPEGQEPDASDTKKSSDNLLD